MRAHSGTPISGGGRNVITLFVEFESMPVLLEFADKVGMEWYPVLRILFVAWTLVRVYGARNHMHQVTRYLALNFPLCGSVLHSSSGSRWLRVEFLFAGGTALDSTILRERGKTGLGIGLLVATRVSSEAGSKSSLTGAGERKAGTL
jgi:hypothetical protein